MTTDGAATIATRDRAEGTLVAVVREQADRQPDAPAVGFLADGDDDLRTLTRSGVDAEARRVASLAAERLAPGSRALLVHEPGLGFLAAFFGCLYAGVVAVPVYPPVPPRLDAGLAHLTRVARDARVGAVLTSRAVHGLLASGLLAPDGLAGLPLIVTDDPVQGDADAWRDPGVRPSTLAFLQYTSGSTADPKGVALSHDRLMANQRAIDSFLRMPADGVMVSWLPLYHDMGLIGTVLQPLYRGLPCWLLSPLHFLQRPGRWLRAMARFGGTVSGAPNFAYDLCVRRVPEEERDGLDLSSWRVAFNGSEPLRPATLRRFTETFGPCGFRADALVGCYGLAEATLLVAGAWPEDPKVLAVDTADLRHGRVTPRAAAGPGVTELVSSGRVHSGHELRIVDPATRLPAAPGRVGEVWFRGPSVARGYWQRPEETAATFGATLADGRGPFLRTGDLGFMAGGQLYVTGRLKDLLVVRGRNVHPHDVEDAAQQADDRLRRGGGAAFPLGEAALPGDGATAAGDAGAGDDGAVEDGEEAVVLVQETGATAPADLAVLAAAARRAVLDAHQVRLAAVFLVPPRAVSKTSSGKVRRLATRTALLTGELPVLHVGRDPAAPVPAARPEPQVGA